MQVHVGTNCLKELPIGLAHAASLLTLDASCNQLSSLQPNMLTGIRGLTSLKLAQNLLEGQFPPEIGCMTRCCTSILREHSERQSSHVVAWVVEVQAAHIGWSCWISVKTDCRRCRPPWGGAQPLWSCC